jgi:hypothetical protein
VAAWMAAHCPLTCDAPTRTASGTNH